MRPPVIWYASNGPAWVWWLWRKASEIKCLLRGPHQLMALVPVVIVCERCPVWYSDDGPMKSAWWYL